MSRGRRRERGFTLVEVIIALAIVGALLVIAFGGLRVATSAWTQGEDRAESHQHVRSIALILARALAGSYPYRATRKGALPEPVVLFAGTEQRVEFVTQETPFPAAIPIGFTAVIFSVDESGETGLVVRQRALPNREPFAEATIVFRDPTVTALKLSYLDEGGGWKDSWDGAEAKATPRAVRITVATSLNGRTETMPPLTVSLRTAPPE